MKKLFSNKKIQIISTVVMGLIFILLFTRGIPYGIKISSESVHDKYMFDAGMYSENILLIYNIILNTKDIDKTTKDYLIKILTILGNELIKPKKEK